MYWFVVIFIFNLDKSRSKGREYQCIKGKLFFTFVLNQFNLLNNLNNTIMKTDAYTKIILTVIAVCLTINLVKGLDLIPSAHAKINDKNLATPQSETVDVRIVDIGWRISPIPVKVVER